MFPRAGITVVPCALSCCGSNNRNDCVFDDCNVQGRHVVCSSTPRTAASGMLEDTATDRTQDLVRRTPFEPP